MDDTGIAVRGRTSIAEPTESGAVDWIDLRGWLALLERHGELHRVQGEVDPVEEMSAITYLAAQREDAPALLFDKLSGNPLGGRILSNMLGSSRARYAIAVGLQPNASTAELIAGTRALLKRRIPPKMIPKAAAPVNEIVLRGADIDLTALPVPQFWPGDGGRYIGSGDITLTRDPSSGRINVGAYRQMLHSKDRVGLYCSPGKHGRLDREAWWQRGEPCEVVAAYGVDPVLFMVGAQTFGANESEFDAAGGLMGRPVEFTGYDETVSEGVVRGIVAAGGVVGSASEGDEIELVLDRTPFYAEGGGQLADQGVIELANGATLEVRDVQSPVTGLTVHRAVVLAGEVTVGTGAQALVDVSRRRAISRSHTATHMVHKAFREALGETATQAGSENSPGRFRFDFSATGAVPASVMADVEARVNEVVIDDLGVHAEVMSQADAVKSGAMALFGEKYGDVVRVVSVGDWARELCGGTHTQRSGQLGVVKLLGESSIGSGVRRVEALVGGDAYRFLAREHVIVAQLAEALKARPEELPQRVNDIVEKLRIAEKEIDRIRLDALLGNAAGLAEGAQQVDGVCLVLERVDGIGGGEARQLALDIRGRFAESSPAVVVLLGVADGKVAVMAATNDAARGRGADAGALIRAVAPTVGGKGGGKPDLAQGGGTEVSGVAAALEAARTELRRQVGA